MPGAGRPEPRPRGRHIPRALRRTRSPQPHPPPGPALTALRSPPGLSHARGARWLRRRTRGTGPESCKLCTGLGRRGSRSAPGRSPSAAAGRAPSGSGGAEGGVSGGRAPGAARGCLPRPALPGPLLTSFILAGPLRLPAVTHPELPSLPRPSLLRRPAELAKPVRLLRKPISADPPRRGLEDAAKEGLGRRREVAPGRRLSAEPDRPPGRGRGSIWESSLGAAPSNFQGWGREGISHLRTSSGFGNCFLTATCAGRGHPR